MPLPSTILDYLQGQRRSAGHQGRIDEKWTFIAR
jgi:hypothetical protein